MRVQNRPIALIAHPRACSTAFERLLLSHPDDITCFHELFDDAHYYGPERLGSRFMNDVQAIAASGKANVTYRGEFDEVEKALLKTDEDGRPRRVFVKILARTVVPPNSASATIAPSLRSGDDDECSRSHDVQINPTVLPFSVWQLFKLTFLIRDPRLSVPSVYRLSMPHMSSKTGRTFFLPEDVGWAQLRKFFDYARAVGLVDETANRANGSKPALNGEAITTNLCVIDANDLLRDPTGTLKAYCAHVGLQFSADMLEWDSTANRKKAQEKFEVFEAFHEEVLRSKTLEKKDVDMDRHSDDELFQAWMTEFGEEGAKIIKENVDVNMEHYRHMRQFAIWSEKL